MKKEAQELSESEVRLRSEYNNLLEEQNTIRNREATFRNQLSQLHQLLSAISPKRSFTLPISPRRASDDVAVQSRRSSQSSSPGKIRNSRDSMESVPSQTDNSNHSSQDFWVADIQGNILWHDSKRQCISS